MQSVLAEARCSRNLRKMSNRPNNELNLASEQVGLSHVINSDPKIFQPNLDQKRKLLDICNLPNLYIRSFDLVILKVDEFSEVKDKRDFSLIEVKVTRKYLPNFPKGFFFGMTKNEEDLLRDLGETFQLCLVSIHEKGSHILMLGIDDLNSLIKNKRIQYQINL